MKLGCPYDIGVTRELSETWESLPRPPKGSKKWNPLIIPLFPKCSNGFILGGFHFLDPLGGLGLEGS